MARPQPLEANIPLTVSVPRSLKEEFFRLCQELDVQASQMMRAAIREVIAEHNSKRSKAQGGV